MEQHAPAPSAPPTACQMLAEAYAGILKALPSASPAVYAPGVAANLKLVRVMLAEADP